MGQESIKLKRYESCICEYSNHVRVFTNLKNLSLKKKEDKEELMRFLTNHTAGPYTVTQPYTKQVVMSRKCEQ